MKRRLKENIEINDEVLVDVGPFGEKYRGTVVDINGDVSLGDDVNKVIVFKKDEQVHIFKFEEDLPEGTAVSLNPPTEEQTEEVK